MDVFGIDLAGLVPFIAVGFFAQLIDGALGMAFGVITNTLLVGLLGVPPALASRSAGRPKLRSASRVAVGGQTRDCC